MSFEEMFTKKGFTVSECFNTKRAIMLTKQGLVDVYFGENGTATIVKPNGTHKWYYQKTVAQMNSIINKILDWYNN